jgi:hypothetical protein
MKSPQQDHRPLPWRQDVNFSDIPGCGGPSVFADIVIADFITCFLFFI